MSGFKHRPEANHLINLFSKPVGLRLNWREGGSSINAIRNSIWWRDYQKDMGRLPAAQQTVSSDFSEQNSVNSGSGLLTIDSECTWNYWCYLKMILGPPRYRSEKEVFRTGLDDEYLSCKDVERHFVPWMRTWPEPDDHRWCTGPWHLGELPDWVKIQYTKMN